MLFHRYPEGQRPIQKVGDYGYHVWCSTGALEALSRREYEKFLSEHTGESYLVNFANGAYAQISPGQPLWQMLVKIAEKYFIEVFPTRLSSEYLPWSEAADDPRSFDAIRISTKEPIPVKEGDSV